MRLMLTMVMVLVASSAWAGDARTRLTEAKLAADAGRTDEALRLLVALTSDGAVPEETRCEARVRQAAVMRQMGAVEPALAAFEEAAATCSSQREAMRLLVEALTGVEQAPEHWAGTAMPLRLAIRRTEGGKYTLGYSFGDAPVPPPWNGGPPYTWEPISISTKDAELADVFQLFSQFTGVEFAVSRELLGRKISLEFVDVPGDQALGIILQSQSLRAERWGEGWSIGPEPGSPHP